MEIPAKTADTLRPHRSPCEITCKELLQKFHTNSITRSTILVKTFGILCVSGPPPSPPPRTVVGVTSQTLFTYFALEKNLIKAVFMSVCVAA